MSVSTGDALPYIYALRCPCTHLVRYVGKANNPHSRYSQHLRDSKRSACAKDKWLQALKNMGEKPELIILEQAEDWQEAERRWIGHYSAISPLLNIADGGVPRWYDKGRKASTWPRKVVARYINLSVNCGNLAQALRFKEIASAFRQMQKTARKAGLEDQYEADLQNVFGKALS